MIDLKLVAVLSVVFGLFGFGVTCGYKRQESKIDKLKSNHAQQLAQIEAEAERDLKERQDQINHLQKEFTIADSNYHEAMKHAQNEINKRDADIRALRSVPTVKVKRQVCPANGKDSDSQRANDPERAELDPETAIRIYGITDDGDKAINQLTRLQNTVRALATVCPIEII